jgi:hypothetical protein
MITCYRLFRPFWNNPLGWSAQLFAAGFLGNFVHSIDRHIVNKISSSTDMLLAGAVVWPEATIGASRGTVNLWTVVGIDRSSFHG